MLDAAFRPRASVRIFDTTPPDWIDAVRTFAPAAIAGSIDHLEALAGAVTLTHAVIVFRSPSDPRLTAAQRENLWRAFQVPAFEQVIAADGTLLAAECEAHAGLHIESPRFDCGDHPIDSSPCPCGRPGARLLPAPQLGSHAVAAAKSI